MNIALDVLDYDQWTGLWRGPLSLAIAGGDYDYNDDPKHMAFTTSRYKFVARMFEGKRRVLEVGCADGWKSRIVRQAVKNLTAVDGDAYLIDRAKKEMNPRWPIEFQCRNALDGFEGQFDAVYSLDVMEHIQPEFSHQYLKGLRACAPVCIIGMPSLESQAYASQRSKADHVNCLRGEDLKEHCERYWSQVFIFSMNDEVVSTGFLRMANYLLALCVA